MDAGPRRWDVLSVSDRRDDPFRRALESDERCRIQTAASVEDAVDVLVGSVARTDKDGAGRDVDCVVCLYHDDFDGLALLETVREQWPNRPFVLVADGADEHVSARAVAANVTEVVPWSSSADTVPDLVDRVLAGKTLDRADSNHVEGLSTAAELRVKEQAMDEAPVGITISDPDRPDNPLVYVNDQFERVTGYAPAEMYGRNCRILQGEETDPDAVDRLREAIETETAVTVELRNYRMDGSPFWNEVTVAPLRDDDGTITNFVGFQSDVTDRKEAERALEAERTALGHLLARLDGLLQDVTRDLVGASSRETAETAVCERLAALDGYPFVWTGRLDRTRDAIVPSATAGSASVAVDALDVDLRSRQDSPVARAYETGTVQVVTDETGLGLSPAADHAVEGIVAVPLTYGETTYGVLTIWAGDAGALTDHETAVFEALGRLTATTINALERGRFIGADNVVELEVSLTDPGFFLVALSVASDAPFEYAGAVYHDDGSTGLFVTTPASPEVVEAHASAHAEITSTTLVSAGEENLYEFVVEGSIVTLLAERGAKVHSMTAEGGQARLTVDLPTESDARDVYELAESRYRGCDLVGYHEHERPPRTRQEFVNELDDDLTDRQLTALHTAYVGGFYRPNRQVTGDELADVMGVSRSTFHQHLRAAERKLVGAYVDGSSSRR